MAEAVKKHANTQSHLLTEFTAQLQDHDDSQSQVDTPSEAATTSKQKDQRFRNPLWESHPIYSYLIGSYLANSNLIRETAAEVDLPADDRQAVNFLLEQMISASSPSNFAMTNPEVIEATVESKGANLRRGMNNYLRDLKQGVVTHADPKAFTIGRDLALTAGKVVRQNHIMQLIEYAPTTAEVSATPLLVVPPCINKYYILDLSPKDSFIANLVGQGQRVFLISWINANQDHAHLNWDDYVADGVLDALSTVCNITGQAKAHTLGYCIGGTLLASALAVQDANGSSQAASLSLLASFLDFSDTGDIGLFVDEKMVRKHESKFANGGLFSGADLARTFAYLRPDNLIWPYVVNNYLMGNDPKPFNILHWNSDSTNLPGPMYAWYLRHTYQDNDLKDGLVEVCGCKVDLTKIDLPGVVVACERDHIVPWRAGYDSALLLGAKTEFILAAKGHVAGIINPPAAQKGHYLKAVSNGQLPARSDDWYRAAERHKGSWWSVYAAWLQERSTTVTAPSSCGNARHKPIEDAPGSYVTAPLPAID